MHTAANTRPSRIVFMGTPAFASASLIALLDAHIDVAAVVTAPDRPAGRGLKARASDVKLRAVERGLPVLQPEKLRDPDFLSTLAALDASLFVVVAFRMLPEVLWRMPALGTINLHASLLPDYRGAAPINWAIMNGEQRTGVTTFRINARIDAGDILLRESMDIGPDETAGELHDRLMVKGAALLVRTVQGLLEGALEAMPQERCMVGAALHEAPKLGPGVCRIDWRRSTKEVHDHIRGTSPYPGAWSQLEAAPGASLHFKVLRARPHHGDIAPAAPGTCTSIGDAMLVACGDGWIEALEVQPEGRRRMPAAEYLRGVRSASPGRFITSP